jgi:hypothetical protein
MAKTVQGLTSLRCMLVGVSEAQAAVCASALIPIEMVRAAGVKEACASMSTVLPVMVVAARSVGEAGVAEVSDLAETCAAEVYVIDDPAPPDVVKQLHETLRRADKRRLRADRRDR